LLQALPPAKLQRRKSGASSLTWIVNLPAGTVLRAYEFETTSNDLVLNVGFRIHGGTDVEFDFCVESKDGACAGGPFAVIAGGVTRFIGAQIPPYPRPLFCSLEGLSAITPDLVRRLYARFSASQSVAPDCSFQRRPHSIFSSIWRGTVFALEID
jgi:hypothetical protein